MRVIFLDFDGVILTVRSKLADASYRNSNHDPVLTNLLAKVCQDNGIKIVISSTWRMGQEDCFEVLTNAGLKEFLHEDWRTKWYDSKDLIVVGYTRGHEIAGWLGRHTDVTSYCILDDDNDLLPEQVPFWVKCDSENGMDATGMVRLLTWADPKWRSMKRIAKP